MTTTLLRQRLGWRPDSADRPAGGSESAFFRHLERDFDRITDADVVGNFDADRWDGFPVAIPLERERAWAAGTQALLERDLQSFESVHGLLADVSSRVLFLHLVLFRLLGHRRVRLPSNNDEHWAQRERAQAMQGPESKFAGLFGRLRRMELEFEDQRIALDCWWANVAWTFFLRQYYLERGGVRIRPWHGDCVIDAGACFGDTALAFAASVGDTGRVHSFEIDPQNLEVARHNFGLNPRLAPRISLHNIALGDAEAERFLYGSGPGAQVSDLPGGQPVKMSTIDRLVARAVIERVDFIKMDIEGSELAALQGAVATLARFRPRLAISVYHRQDDLVRIPLWLDQQRLGYEFYLEHYTIHHEETVLYATPRGIR